MARSIQILSHLTWLLHVASWRARSPPPNLMSIQPRRTEIRTTIKSSVRWWCRVMHWGIMSIKCNLHQPKSHVPGFRSWRPSCNKNCMVEIVWFLLKQPESDRTKWVDRFRWCGDEGDRGRPGVAAVFFMNEMMRRRRRRRWKSSWCESIVTRFYFFGLRRY
jgi:hypothetical protein